MASFSNLSQSFSPQMISTFAHQQHIMALKSQARRAKTSCLEDAIATVFTQEQIQYQVIVKICKSSQRLLDL